MTRQQQLYKKVPETAQMAWRQEPLNLTSKIQDQAPTQIRPKICEEDMQKLYYKTIDKQNK